MEKSKIETWIEKNAQLLIIASLLFYIFFVVFTFDAKVSIGGDDSGYIIAAKEFWEGIRFPTWHGAFYPIFISPFVAIFGNNVILLKFISVILVGIQIFILARTFKFRIPWTIWAFLIFLTALNTQIIIYAGTTYSEALFLFIQSFVFLFFYKVDSLDLKTDSKKTVVIQYLLLGLSIFLLALTRNVGYGVLIALIAYFIFRGELLKSLFSFFSFLIFQLPFGIYKRLVWGISDAGFESQLTRIAYKDFYNADKGTEDFWGFVQRFWDNSELYLSKHLMKFLGFLDLSSTNTSTILTIIIYGLFILATIYFIQKKSNLVFVGFYLSVLIAGTFITQQKSWDQERLMLIYLPLIAVYLGTAAYLFLSKYNKVLIGIFTVFLSLIVILNVKNNFNRVDIIQVQKNFKGDRYYGYTPDWENYLKLCSWVGEEIPDDKVVACRKPKMAEIYGGREFLGIYQMPTRDADEMVTFFKENKIDYVIAASLRMNPKANTGRVITTIRFVLKTLLTKYPYALELVKYEGKVEHAFLFKIHLEPEKLSQDMIIKRMESGLLVFPENINGQYNLAVQYAQKGDLSKALERVNFILQSQKGNLQLYAFRGNLHFALKKYKEAIKDYEIVLNKQPQNGEMWYNLGLCYYNLKSPNYRTYLVKAKQLGINVSADLLK